MMPRAMPETIDHDGAPVHNWRAAQLRRLGIPQPLAEVYANPDLFFPIGTTGPGPGQIDQAKRVCLACPVGQRCLARALDLGAASGIWGGTTQDERRALRTAAARHRHRTRKTTVHE